MSVTVQTKVLRDVQTTAQWTTANPVIPDRVQVFDSTVKKYKIGDGVTAWVSLPYWEPPYVPPSSLVFNLNASQGPVYTLSSGRLATVNALGRYGNFSAFINGVRTTGIVEGYTGSPGAFTAITITWDAQDPITVQFS